jgi:hypothetical protein
MTRTTQEPPACLPLPPSATCRWHNPSMHQSISLETPLRSCAASPPSTPPVMRHPNFAQHQAMVETRRSTLPSRTPGRVPRAAEKGFALLGVPRAIEKGAVQHRHPHTASGPLGVMNVSPPLVGLTMVHVLCVTLRLCAHLVGPPMSLGFDAWALLPQRGLGREISRWGWSHPCHRGLRGGSSPTNAGVSRVRGWVRPTPTGALR